MKKPESTFSKATLSLVLYVILAAGAWAGAAQEDSAQQAEVVEMRMDTAQDVNQDTDESTAGNMPAQDIENGKGSDQEANRDESGEGQAGQSQQTDDFQGSSAAENASGTALGGNWSCFSCPGSLPT